MDARSLVVATCRQYREARDRMGEIRRAGIHDHIEWQASQDVNRLERELLAAIDVLAQEVPADHD